MDTREISIAYKEFRTPDLLSNGDRELLEKARESSRSAYAPYSKFYVGAAVKLANGLVFSGNNQENSSYPSGLCAERVALFAASSQQPGVPVETIAVYAHTHAFDLVDPVTPCGSCRQVMAEYEHISGGNIRVILQSGESRIWLLDGISNLLPFMFHEEKLKK